MQIKHLFVVIVPWKCADLEALHSNWGTSQKRTNKWCISYNLSCVLLNATQTFQTCPRGWDRVGEGCNCSVILDADSAEVKYSKTEVLLGTIQLLLCLVKVCLCLWARASVITLGWCDYGGNQLLFGKWGIFVDHTTLRQMYSGGGSTQPEKTQIRQTYRATYVANGCSQVPEIGWCCGRTLVTELEDPGKSRFRDLSSVGDGRLLQYTHIYIRAKQVLSYLRGTLNQELGNRGVIRHIHL